MAGFVANSRWSDDHWGRLQRTGEWVATVTYGTTAQAEQAGRRLRRLHGSLPPVPDPAGGPDIRVDDPDLVLWVHCTEVESFLSTYRRCGGHLAPGDGDRYVAEMRESARLVGLDPGRVPSTEAQIENYYRSVRPRLQVGDLARRQVLRGVTAPMPRWVALATPARAAWLTLVSTGAGMLPRWAWRLYGLPGLPTTDLTATLTGRALRTALLLVPDDVRAGPARRAALARLAG